MKITSILNRKSRDRIRKQRRSQRLRTRLLRSEPLEPRTLLSADFSLSGGMLTLDNFTQDLRIDVDGAAITSPGAGDDPGSEGEANDVEWHVGTFDDAPVFGHVSLIQDGYLGFKWNGLNRAWAAHEDMRPESFRNAAVSGNYVAYNLGLLHYDTQTVTITPVWTGDTFVFKGAYLTAQWKDDLNINVRGFLADELVYETTVIVDTTGPTWFDFDYRDIDKLTFFPFGGTPIREGIPWYANHFGMDHFTFRPSVDLAAVANANNAPPDKFFWNPADAGGGFTFTYFVGTRMFRSWTSFIDLPPLSIPDTTIHFYWATGNTDNGRIPGALAYQYDLDTTGRKAGGLHEVSVSSAEFLSDPPEDATHLLMVIDPLAQVEELSELNNVAALALVDLVALGNPEPLAPDRFFWHPVEQGGGFTFSYAVSNQAEAEIPNASIEFYWSTTEGQEGILPDLPAVFRLELDRPLPDGVEVVLGGPDLKAQGIHTLAVTHAALEEGVRSPGWTAKIPQPMQRASHLVMVIDPSNDVDGSGSVIPFEEERHVKALEVVPLVVVAATHGWNSTGAAWSPYAPILAGIPEDDSVLDGRVAVHVPAWESSGLTGPFTEAFVTLAAGKLIAPVRPKEAFALHLLAQLLAQRSAVDAQNAAVHISDELIAKYLLSDQHTQAGELQRIHLVGHSRGAAVNAGVSRLLMDRGYYVDQYTSLDGHSVDWPSGGGLIGDIPIQDAIAARRVNYRVEQGLASGILDEFLYPGGELPEWARTSLDLWLGDLRAPCRPSFENTYVQTPKVGGSLTHHMNVTERYMLDDGQLAAYYDPESQFILDNYLGWNRFAEVAGEALQRGQFIQNDGCDDVEAAGIDSFQTSFSAAEGEVDSFTTGSVSWRTGFFDGTFEQLGELQSSMVDLDLTPTGDPFVDFWLEQLDDPLLVLATNWDIAGSVRLVVEDENTLLELVGTTQTEASQQIILPDRAKAIEFDMQIMEAGAGHLYVLFNDEILDYFSLAELPASDRYTVSFNDAFAQQGVVSFRLEGSVDASAVVQLDNLDISVVPNNAPVLEPSGFAFPPIINGDLSAAAVGIAVADLVSGISDVDQGAQKGIAIVGTKAAAGTAQYSLDDGKTWQDVGAVSNGHALLLAPFPMVRVRFMPHDDFQGAVQDAITFRAWDRTTGIRGLTGEYFDARDMSTTSPFSSESDEISVNVVPAAGWDLGTGDQVVTGTLASGIPYLFEWTADAEGLLGVTLTSPTPGALVEFEILNANEQEMAGGRFWQDSASPAIALALEAQTYFIRIEEFAGLETDFELVITNHPERLENLGAGHQEFTGTMGSHEFHGFQWTADTDGLLTVTGTSTTPGADFVFDIFDRSGVWITGGEFWNGTPIPATVPVTADRTYFILVDEWAGLQTQYDLTFTSDPDAIQDLGLIAGPQPPSEHTIDQLQEGHLFRFETAATGSADHFARIDFIHAAGDLDMQLFDRHGTPVDSSESSNDFELISLADLPSGRYYLYVYGFAGAVNDYTLTIHAPPAGIPANARPVRTMTEVDAAVEIDVLAIDADGMQPTLDPASVRIESLPQFGEAEVDSDTGSIRFIPSSGFAGYDRFRYSVADQHGQRSNEALIEVTVLAPGLPPWQNPAEPLDVNGDGAITPIDALLVINEINRGGAGTLPAPSPDGTFPLPYFDVNGDDLLSPIDALIVINCLNRPNCPAAAGDGGGEGEGEPFTFMEAAGNGGSDGGGQPEVPASAAIVHASSHIGAVLSSLGSHEPPIQHTFGLEAPQTLNQGVSVLNILVDFEDMPGAPISVAETENAFLEASEFLRSTSWGQFWFDEVVVTDTYRMPHPTTWYTQRSNGDSLLQAHARAAAQNDGHRISDHWSYSVTFDRIHNWSWAGKGWVGEPGIWLNGRGSEPTTIAHEFGHNLGMRHSGLWRVDDGDAISPNGRFVVGDVFDLMSHGNRLFPEGQFNTYWKTHVGWMDSNSNVLNAFAEGPHRLYAHDLGPGTFVEDRIYAIEIPTDEGPDYWLEFRQAPYEGISEAGVQIRWSPSYASWFDVDTVLLDMSGGEFSYDTRLVDVPLSIGATFVDSQAGIEITPVQSGVADDGNWWVDVAVTGLPVAAELDGQMGNRGQFVSAVTVTLHASDFRLNDDPWQTYSEPFTVEASGTHTLDFRRIDAAGNVVDVRSVSFEIVALPVSTIALDGQQGNDDWFTSPVTVTLAAIPGSLGVSRTEYRLNNFLPTFHSFADADEDFTVEFQVETEGIHTLVFHSVDRDGNAGPAGSAHIRIDTSAPEARLMVDDVVTTFGTSLTFDVSYSDNLGLDLETIVDNNQALRVTGPGGLDTFAEFLSFRDGTDETSRIATYRIWSPGGTWQPHDGGSFAVSVKDDQVADPAGNFVFGTSLGSFVLRVLETETPWQNPHKPLDVNDDGVISPIDALLIINYLNRDGAGLVTANVAPPYLDVNGDNYVSPIDALLVINFLNNPGDAEGEDARAPSGEHHMHRWGEGEEPFVASQQSLYGQANRLWAPLATSGGTSGSQWKDAVPPSQWLLRSDQALRGNGSLGPVAAEPRESPQPAFRHAEEPLASLGFLPALGKIDNLQEMQRLEPVLAEIAEDILQRWNEEAWQDL